MVCWVRSISHCNAIIIVSISSQSSCKPSGRYRDWEKDDQFWNRANLIVLSFLSHTLYLDDGCYHMEICLKTCTLRARERDRWSAASSSSSFFFLASLSISCTFFLPGAMINKLWVSWGPGRFYKSSYNGYNNVLDYELLEGIWNGRSVKLF
jgi:hypothetical protein